LGTPSLLYSR